MAVIKCEICGYHFDDEKYKVCPNCGRNDLVYDQTVSLEAETDRTLDETVDIEVSIGRDISEDVTIGTYSVWTGNSPVVGWLVCTKGNAKGRDYRLFNGWNRIGRSTDMNICLADDMAISRKHCAVVYDQRAGRFHLVNDSGAPTYLNGVPLYEPQELKGGDVITMGENDFVFIPFCTEERKW